MILEKANIRNILVRTPNWIGDVVMSLPAMEALKANFPDSNVTVLAKPWVKDLLEDTPWVSEILLYEPDRGPLNKAKSVIATARRIKQRGYDVAFLFQNAFEAALLVWLGRIGRRVGYRIDGRGALLTHGVAPDKDTRAAHQVEYYLNLLRQVGLDAPTKDPVLSMPYVRTKRARELIRHRGGASGHVTVGIGPGAIYGQAKRWPADRFARLADIAAERWKANILIFGSEKEKHIGESVQETMKQPCINLCGNTSLKEAMELLSACDFFVTNDSGLMHVSAALGVPTLAIFGSTDPMATGPRGPKTRVVRHEVDCAPCLRTSCPTDFRCMLSVEVEEVWNELEKLRMEILK